MNIAIKLFLVAVLALMLAPHSLGNEWVPPDMIKASTTPAAQADRFVMKNSPTYRSADNPADIGKSVIQKAKPVVQHTPMNEWVPPDMLRTWVFPPDP